MDDNKLAELLFPQIKRERRIMKPCILREICRKERK